MGIFKRTMGVISDSIDSGEHFFVSGYETKGTSEVIEFVVTTPNTETRVHMTFSMNSDKGMTIGVYEGASGITGGGSATPINSDRNSSTASTLTVVKDPSSITGDGTLIDSYTSGAKSEAGFIDEEHKLILKQNETYLFRITSKDNANDIGYKGTWYERVS